MNKCGVLITVFLGAILVSAAAFAEDAAPQQQSVWSELRSKVTASAESRFYGPALTDMTSIYTPDVRTGAPKYMMITENKLSVNYWLTKDLALNAQYENYFTPVATHDLSLKDPSVAMKLNHVVQNGVYNMDTAARFYAGLSSNSQNLYHQWGALRLSQSSSVRPQGSRFRFDLYTQLQFDLLSQSNDKSWTREYLVIPSMEYRLSRTVAANLSYKLWAYHTLNQGLFEANTDKGLAGPGVVWNILPNLSFNPYVDIAVNNMVAMSTTTVGALLWWGFL